MSRVMEWTSNRGPPSTYRIRTIGLFDVHAPTAATRYMSRYLLPIARVVGRQLQAASSSAAFCGVAKLLDPESSAETEAVVTFI